MKINSRLRIFGLFFLLLFLFASVGGVHGETLTVANSADIQNLDPAFITDAISSRVANQIFDHLVEFGRNGEIVPGLAQSWEFSEDGQVVTFHLREGVRFHNGNHLTAEAVEFSFRRVMDEDIGSPHGEKYRKAIENIEVVDDLTVKFELSEPNAAFLALYMTTSPSMIVSPEAVQSLGEDFGLKPVGSGPFKFERYKPDELVELSKNEDYWGEKPKVDKLAFRPIPEPITRVIELRTGGVDMVVAVPPAQMESLKENKEIEVQEAPLSTIRGFWFQHQDSPFNDPRLKKAFAFALDEEEIYESFLKGSAVRADSLIPMQGWAHNELLTEYGHDLERAKALLEQAGWVDEDNDGIREKCGEELVIDLISPSGRYLKDEEITQAAAYQWEKLGVKINTSILKSSAWIDRMTSSQFDVTFLGWAKDIPEPALFFNPLVRTGGRTNFFNYSNLFLDRLIDRGAATFDRERRIEIYEETQRILHQDVVFVPLYNDIGSVAIVENLEYEWSPSQPLELERASFG